MGPSCTLETTLNDLTTNPPSSTGVLSESPTTTNESTLLGFRLCAFPKFHRLLFPSDSLSVLEELRKSYVGKDIVLAPAGSRAESPMKLFKPRWLVEGGPIVDAGESG